MCSCLLWLPLRSRALARSFIAGCQFCWHWAVALLPQKALMSASEIRARSFKWLRYRGHISIILILFYCHSYDLGNGVLCHLNSTNPNIVESLKYVTQLLLGESSITEPYHLLPYPRPINSVSETHSVISQTQRPYVTTTIAECDVFGRGADVHLSELAEAVHRWIIEL